MIGHMTLQTCFKAKIGSKRSKMRIFLITFWLTHLFLLGTSATGQNTSDDLTQLKSELFQSSKEKAFAYQFLQCEMIAEDSTLLIFNQQPNSELCLTLLHNLLKECDETSLEDVVQTYDRFLQSYLPQWQKMFLRYSRIPECTGIREQFKILRGFEELLIALRLKRDKVSNEEIFKKFYNQVLDDITYAGNRNSPDIINKYDFHSRDYIEMRKVGWFAFNPGFQYIDAYTNVTKEYFIQTLIECSWEINNDNPCLFVWLTSDYYYGIKHESIVQYFLSNYDNWSENLRAAAIFTYAGHHHLPELTQFLTNKLLSDSQLVKGNIDPRNYYLGLLSKETKNHPLIKEILFSEIKQRKNSDDLKIFEYLLRFQDDQTAEVLMDLNDDRRFNERWQNAIKSSLQAFLNARTLSPSYKIKVEDFLSKHQ